MHRLHYSQQLTCLKHLSSTWGARQMQQCERTGRAKSKFSRSIESESAIRASKGHVCAHGSLEAGGIVYSVLHGL